MFRSSVKGPDLFDLKLTVENLQAALSGREYQDGLDQESTITMVGAIYCYVTGGLRYGLPLPAPACDPEDKHRVMWPEGMKVKSRRPSVSSVGSKHNSGVNRYGLRNDIGTSYAKSRASSVTSTSKYSSRYVGIAEEEDDDPRPVRQPTQRHDSFRKYNQPEPVDYPKSRKQVSYDYTDSPRDLPIRSNTGKRSMGTHRVSDAAMKPTPSMETFMVGGGGVELGDESEPDREPVLKPRSSRHKKQSKFADDE